MYSLQNQLNLASNPNVFTNEREKKIISLLQRASFLQSHGATEENNKELYQISQEIQLLKNIQTSNLSISSQPPHVNYHSGVDESSIFTPNQLAAFNYQLMTYRLLSKDAPIPFNLQKAVLAPFHTLTSSLPTPKVSKLSYSQQMLDKSRQTSKIKNKEKFQQKRQLSIPTPSITNDISTMSFDTQNTVYNSYIPPSSVISKPIPYILHASKYQKTIIPSLLPIGINPQHNISQRRSRLLSHIHHCKDNIQPNSIKNIIQRKAISLMEKQAKLRNELVLGMSKYTRLANTINKPMFRIQKRLSINDSRLAEVMERHQYELKKQAIIAEEQHRLQTICNHGIQLINHKKLKMYQLSRLGHEVVQYHYQIKQKTVSITKEKMQTFKKTNKVAYHNMVNKIKHDRLNHILIQIDSFIDSMSRLANNQKRIIFSTRNLTSALETQEIPRQPNILIGGHLKEYQLQGLRWMISLYNNQWNGVLADEMRIGKTIQTISFIAYLIENKNQHGPFLIVVPSPVLINWILELDKWAPSISKVVYKGSLEVKYNLTSIIIGGNYQILLTTFDHFISDKNILRIIKWEYIFVDGDRHMMHSNLPLITILRRYYYTKYRFILTDVFSQNNLSELWSLVNITLPKLFQTVQTFDEWFNKPFVQQGVYEKIELNNEEQLFIIKCLYKVLWPFLLQRKVSDLNEELPKKFEHIIKCKKSALQHLLCQNIRTNDIMSFDKPISTLNEMSKTIIHIRKACNHPFLFSRIETEINPNDEANELLYRCSGKFELLDRMLPKLIASGHHILMFFQMTETIFLIEKYLTWRNYSYLRYDGSRNRTNFITHLQQIDTPYYIFLLSTKDLGLNFQKTIADTIIIFDSDWNFNQTFNTQIFGQSKQIYVFTLVTSNSIDERLLERTCYKLDSSGRITRVNKFNGPDTQEDREFFLRYLLGDKMDENMNENLDNDYLNVLLKRSEEELKLFKKMDTDIKRHKGRRGHQKQLSGLIQKEELSTLLNVEEIFKFIEPAPLAELGRGRRVKQRVKYTEALNDEEWFDAINDEEIDESDHQKSKAKYKRLETKEYDFKRNRLLQLTKQELTRVFQACYTAVEESIEEDEDGYRPRCELFMDLVDEDEYPIYYEVIKNPISMNIIKERIQTGYYKDIHEFEKDFHLMFDNARLFNEENSLVYEDANELQYIFDQTLKEQSTDSNSNIY